MDNNILQKGQTSNYVIKLQQFLNIRGYKQIITGYFGSITQVNLKEYQRDHEMPETGIVDSNLFSLINTSDKLDTWCHAIQEREGFFSPGENPNYLEGTPAWRNNNPGNLVFENQIGAKSSGRFACFSTYQDGYNALKNLLIWACTGQTTLYNPNGSLVDFYAVYAPSDDGNNPESYAAEVAKALNVEVGAPINNFLL